MVTSPELVGVLSAVEKRRSPTINSQYMFYIFVRESFQKPWNSSLFSGVRSTKTPLDFGLLRCTVFLPTANTSLRGHIEKLAKLNVQ